MAVGFEMLRGAKKKKKKKLGSWKTNSGKDRGTQILGARLLW
jgi:hypothetical protein